MFFPHIPVDHLVCSFWIATIWPPLSFPKDKEFTTSGVSHFRYGVNLYSALE